MKISLANKILFLSLIVFGIYSCTEKIDIQLDEADAKLAVESYIYAEKDSGFVKLTQTAGYFSNQPAQRISNATVTVEVNDRLYVLPESQYDKGFYLTPPDFTVELTDSLFLAIDLQQDIAGESHYKASTYMPSISDQIDSIKVIYRADFDFWILQLYAYDPPGPNFYMFNVLRNDTLITDSISETFVTDDRLVDDIYINGVYVNFLPGKDLHSGDTVTLVTSSITKDYYDFVLELQTEIGYKDPLFSGPPANVSTNLTNGAVGYFSAFPSAYTKYVIPPDVGPK
jgi:hypothetical protein